MAYNSIKINQKIYHFFDLFGHFFNLLIRQKSALVKKTSFCVSKYAPVKKSYKKNNKKKTCKK